MSLLRRISALDGLVIQQALMDSRFKLKLLVHETVLVFAEAHSLAEFRETEICTVKVGSKWVNFDWAHVTILF